MAHDRTRWVEEEPNPRQRRIAAVLRARAARALAGDVTELVRLLNFRLPTWSHTSHLIERHQSEGTLPDEWANEWAIWQAVNAMRDLARALVGARGNKRHVGLRETFCECLGRLLESRPVFVASYPVMLWTPEQRERIEDVGRLLAPRLLVALWEADPHTLRRLRECGYPECPRPWFVGPSTGRPRRYCPRTGHSVRTSERVAPVKKRVLAAFPKGRWLSWPMLEVAVGPVPHPYLSVALKALVAEGRLRRRTVPAESLGREAVAHEGPGGPQEVLIGPVVQYRRA